MGLDPKTGAIHRLRNKKSKREWASSEHPLALFSYQTLSQQDYSRFFDSYVVSDEDWAKKDFGKPNIERFGAKSREWLPTRRGSCKWTKTTDGHHLLARLEINDAEALRSGRASFPQKMYLEMMLAQSRAGDLSEFFLVSKAGDAPSRGSLAELSSDCLRSHGLDAGEIRRSRCLPWMWCDPAIVTCMRSRKASATRMRSGSLFVETLDAPVVTLGVKVALALFRTPA